MIQKLFKTSLLVCLLINVFLRAQTISDLNLTRNFYVSGDMMSYSGAYRAVSKSSSSMILNPAGIAQKPGAAQFSGTYSWAGHTSSNAWSASAIDYKTTQKFAFGVYYGNDNPTIAGTKAQVHFGALAIAKDIIPNVLFVGSNIKAYKARYSLSGSSGPSGIDVDLGVLFSPSKLLSIAVTANHLVNGTQIEEFPLIIGGGIALNLDDAAKLLIDVEKDFATARNNVFNAYFGAEAKIADGIVLRGGFALDKIQNNDFFTVGLALVSDKINVVGSYQQKLNPNDSVIGVGLDMMF